MRLSNESCESTDGIAPIRQQQWRTVVHARFDVSLRFRRRTVMLKKRRRLQDAFHEECQERVLDTSRHEKPMQVPVEFQRPGQSADTTVNKNAGTDEEEINCFSSDARCVRSWYGSADCPRLVCDVTREVHVVRRIRILDGAPGVSPRMLVDDRLLHVFHFRCRQLLSFCDRLSVVDFAPPYSRKFHATR
jgi:hypothetical protein